MTTQPPHTQESTPTATTGMTTVLQTTVDYSLWFMLDRGLVAPLIHPRTVVQSLLFQMQGYRHWGGNLEAQATPDFGTCIMVHTAIILTLLRTS